MELPHALELAAKVLDRVNADPDGDLAVLARQLQRQAELADKYKWQVRDTCTRAERAEQALVGIIDAWGNRGETTSLDVWNRRVKAAIIEARQIPGVEHAYSRIRLTQTRSAAS